jgi:ABC-type amino acid transport substrate-binding protein
MTRKRPHRWLQAGLNIAIVAALLAAVSYLPPDTSLQDRQRDGVLKVCVPASYPPLITGDPARPGFDAELADAIAKKLRLKLALNVLPSIGRDFNPRNWSLTRAQCDIIAGGVADTAQTRSFLQTIPTAAETGWVGISASGELPATGSTVAVLPGTAGLDRLALSGWMRKQGLRAQLMPSADAFARSLRDGTVAAGITERFVAANLGLSPSTMQTFWLSDPAFPRYRMALGLWKGDQTLKRAVLDALGALDASSIPDALAVRYGLVAEFGAR